MQFTVDPPVLKTAAQKFTQLSQEYTTVYTRLLNAAQTMGDAWNAEDNLAFVNQINGFCEELRLMSEHLEQASKTLIMQANNYETVRDNNTSNVRRLAN